MVNARHMREASNIRGSRAGKKGNKAMAGGFRVMNGTTRPCAPLESLKELLREMQLMRAGKNERLYVV